MPEGDNAGKAMRDPSTCEGKRGGCDSTESNPSACSSRRRGGDLTGAIPPVMTRDPAQSLHLQTAGGEEAS